MRNVSDREWKTFTIQDLFVTDITNRGEVQVPTGAYVEKKYLENGTLPRVTVTSLNNGIDGFYSSNHSNYRVFKNFISVSFLGTIFYQQGEASLDMKVHCLKLKDRELNWYLSAFLISEIRNSIADSSYGNQLSSTDLPRKKILLPVDKKGLPDYAFMEDFIKEREAKKRSEYLQYAKAQLDKLGGVRHSLSLPSYQWKSFFITDIFPSEIQRGKRLIHENQIPGLMPYVSSTALNNGVDCFIGNDVKIRSFSDCISLANSGSVGSCFYEPFEFVASDHVTHLKREGLSPWSYLFIATMLRRLSEKYNYNREISDNRIAREKVLLPVKISGEPDYEYMERYMKNIMIGKYTTYIDYVS